MSEGAGPAELGVPGLVDASELKSTAVATTYRARDEASGRTVIVKVLGAALEGQQAARFEHEQAQMVGLSDHPNIVTVYGYGTTEGGRPYVVYEDVPGGTIRDRMNASGPLSGPDILQLGIRLSGAVESAHRVSVLHGDIRPEDVLVNTYGEPLLADFGLAALVAPPASTTTDPTRLAHVAPELLDQGRPSPATDVYALGSTLFTLLAGRHAFVRDDDTSVFAVVKRIASDPVPDLRGENVPDDACRVIEKAMAKNPQERYESAEALGRALQQAQVSLGLPMTEMTVLGGAASGAAGAPTTAMAAAPPTAAFPVAGPPAGPPTGPPGPPGPPPPPIAGKKKSKAPLAIAAVVLLILLGGGAAIALSGGDDEGDDEPARTTTTDDDDGDDETTTTEEETTTTEDQITTTTLPDDGGGGGELGDDESAAARSVLALPSGAAYSGATSDLTDDSGALTMSVPEEWSDSNGSQTDLGATLQAAPNLQSFIDTFDTPGVIFTASPDLSGEDLAQLLADIAPGGCTSEGTGDYFDGVFTGLFEVLSNCGGTSSGIVSIAARNDDNTETVRVLVQLVTDADFDALDQIVQSFLVGDL